MASSINQSHKDSHGDVFSKSRVFSFIIFNFVEPLNRSLRENEAYTIRKMSLIQKDINDAYAVLKNAKADCPDDDILSRVDVWRSINQSHFNGVYTIVYNAFVAEHSHDFKTNAELPLHNLMHVSFYPEPEEGILELFKCLISLLGSSLSLRSDGKNKNLSALIYTVNILTVLESALIKDSITIYDYIKSDEELKIAALIVNLSTLVGEKRKRFIRRNQISRYVATNFSSIAYDNLPTKNNHVKLQAVIDSIICSYLIHDLHEASLMKEKINAILDKCKSTCSADKIKMKSTVIKNLVRHQDVFLKYVRNNVFKELCDSDWYDNYERYAKEQNRVYDFFTIMGAAFIPAVEIDGVLKKASEAIRKTVARQSKVRS